MITDEVSGTESASGPQPPSTRLRDLHPGWFASVMGTGIVAVATFDNPGNFAATRAVAEGFAVGFAVLAYVLAAVLLVAYAMRWVRHVEAAEEDLHHPVMGAMHATVPAGILVLAIMTSIVGPSFLPADAVAPLIAVLAVVGALLGLVVSVAFAYQLFVSEHPASAANGVWFIPPVGTIIIPLALMTLVPHVGMGAARLLVALGYATFGMGFLLFIFTMGLLHNRLVQHALPPAVLAPSVWIGLGPVGVGALVPLALARGGAPLFGDVGPAVGMISLLVSTAIWGFGLWWIAIAVALLVRYLRNGGVPFHLGWWAFTFPLGAFTVASLNLARAWQLAALEVVTVALYLLLVAFWGIVSVRTVAAVRSGSIWAR
ncbi:MAG: hypothetical protein CVT64_10645 [Actinobacteria bacterium HGW-Actinobacteria-4]|nr:MAG: hypothetical protein CVT64_10645 [Actinobacteria bacterium HGW-Actinobacteria-4]